MVENNQAFIDGQNLYFNTVNAERPWIVDLTKLRVYLREKYGVDRAYYFLGIAMDDHQTLYRAIQEAGFILIFRKHTSGMAGHKKGNVDTDIVFAIMQKMVEQDEFDKVVLVSGDGDYYRMVEYLIKKGRFAKLLSPNRRSTSSLYRSFTPRYVDFLDNIDVQRKIARG